MKRHLAILAFGVLVAGSVTYAQIAPQGSSQSSISSASQSASQGTTAASVSSIAKPSITGGGESDD